MADFAKPDETPVTTWLRQLEAGDGQAAQQLYQHFCTRLHELARKRLPARVKRAYDQDDVAVSALHSLFHGVHKRQFELNDRNDIWRLLLTIAERKIAKRVRYETRDKRDVRRVVQDSLFVSTGKRNAEHNNGGQTNVDSLPGHEPTPELAAEVAETCESLLASLPDKVSRNVALHKLEGYSAEEIATKLGCSRRTVQRKLLVIRRLWQHAHCVDSENGAASGKAGEGENSVAGENNNNANSDVSQNADGQALDA